jgi:hypothetical protein
MIGQTLSHFRIVARIGEGWKRFRKEALALSKRRLLRQIGGGS